jgi:aspartate aminotransferase
MTTTNVSPPSVTARAPSRLSRAAGELGSSKILRIAAEVRALATAGQPILNLTVGDFSPAEFHIPHVLRDEIVDALRSGESNYPPPNGLETLRAAIQGFAERSFGVRYAIDSVLVTAGARPAIYSLYRTVVDRGDRVVYGVPSWCNSFYCEIVGASQVPVACDASTHFLPTADRLAKVIRGARLLALNSPLNPTGTAFSRQSLAAICDLVLEENARRGAGERPLYVFFDAVYWMLMVGDTQHADPVALRPEMAPYTITVDAISKSFAATGLRVGWALGPRDVIGSMADLVSHVGAWAPRPEQVATARLLADETAVRTFAEGMRREVGARVHALASGLATMRAEGLPVDCVQPQGAIYVSARFNLAGMRAPDGTTLATDEHVRQYLLRGAGLAAIPFDAFDLDTESGWFRLSVGAVSVKHIEDVLPRIRAAITACQS